MKNKIRKAFRALLVFTILFITNLCIAQKNKTPIIKSDNIADIENFLNTAHPDDPRRPVLKKRVISLKNELWTKGRIGAQPMAARPVKVNLEVKNVDFEEEEFRKLMKENQSEELHKQTTVNLLNALLENNPDAAEAILMFRNKTGCNIVLQVAGNGRKYRIPVPSYNETPVVVPKGTYEMQANFCDSSVYTSQKDIRKNTMIELIIQKEKAQLLSKNINNEKLKDKQ